MPKKTQKRDRKNSSEEEESRKKPDPDMEDCEEVEDDDDDDEMETSSDESVKTVVEVHSRPERTISTTSTVVQSSSGNTLPTTNFVRSVESLPLSSIECRMRDRFGRKVTSKFPPLRITVKSGT